MNIERRDFAGAVIALGALAAVPAMAAGKEEDAVLKKVEALRAAMFARDAKALDALTAPELTYSHSSGVVQDKKEYINGVLNSPSKTLSLKWEQPWSRVTGDAAVVRFHWVSQSEDKEGKKSDTSLHILMVWQKRNGDWKLLARGSTKL